MVETHIINTTTSVLTPEGVEIATNGSHEARVWSVLPLKGQGEPMTIPELQVSTVSALTSGRPETNARKIDRNPWDPKLPRLVKERHSRISGSRRRELDLSRL